MLASLQRLEMRYHRYGKEAIAALGNALNNNQTFTSVVIAEKEYEVNVAVQKLKKDMKDRTPKVDIYYME